MSATCRSQAPDAVPWRDRPCQYDDSQPFWVHGRSPAVVAARSSSDVYSASCCSVTTSVSKTASTRRRAAAPNRAASAESCCSRRACARNSSADRAQQSRLPVHDDVTDPSRLHGDDWTAKGARLNEDARQRLWPGGREDQHRGVTHPLEQLRPLEPPEKPDIPAGTPARASPPPHARDHRPPPPRAARDRRLLIGARTPPLLAASLPAKSTYGRRSGGPDCSASARIAGASTGFGMVVRVVASGSSSRSRNVRSTAELTATTVSASASARCFR